MYEESLTVTSSEWEIIAVQFMLSSRDEQGIFSTVSCERQWLHRPRPAFSAGPSPSDRKRDPMSC